MTATRERLELDPAIADMNARMAATGDFPIFTDAAGNAVESTVARERGIRVRNKFYPRQFFAVASVTDAVIPGPAGDIQIRIQRPIGGSDATVVYYHGGGWIIGDLDSHEANASRIAAHANAHVIQVHYRLSPENPFPAGLGDAVAALRWVAEHIGQFGGNPDKLVVAGDSAGGNLAAATAQYCRDNGIPLAAQFLIYPATDLRPMANDPVGQQYLGLDGPADPADPRVSPAANDHLGGLAPAIIGVGSYDFLRDDNATYAAKLATAGVSVIFREYPTINHGFFSYGNVSPASDQAAEEMVEDLRQLLHP
jgi:acetyl esterase/lipase